MSAALEHPRRHAVSVEEYLRMGEAGVFAPDARLELIEGEIIEMAPIGVPHASIVGSLTRLFVRQAGDAAFVWVQNPGYASVTVATREAIVHSIALPEIRTSPREIFRGF